MKDHILYDSVYMKGPEKANPERQKELEIGTEKDGNARKLKAIVVAQPCKFTKNN